MVKKKATPRKKATVKKASKPKPVKKEPAVITELSANAARKVGRIVVLMTKVYDMEVIEAVCRKDLGIPENEIDAAITKARGELVKATEYHVKEEYGRALLAFRELFTSSVKLKDNKTALATLKEICRFQGLYDKGRLDHQDGTAQESIELQQIRDQLTPFRLTSNESAPVSELIRLLLIDYMRLIYESRPAQRDYGGTKPPAVACEAGNLPLAADQRPRKKK